MTNDIIDEATSGSAPVSTTDQDEKNMGMLTWILTLFFGFIPSLIIYFVKKDNAYLKDQSKEALNWSITVIFAYIIALILTAVVIGVFLIPVIGICHLVFCIMGAVSTSKGDGFRVPFAIRLIK